MNTRSPSHYSHARPLRGPLALVLLLLLVASAGVARADEAVLVTPAKNADQAKAARDEGIKYLRVRRDANQEPTALETAVTRFVSRQGAAAPVVVDLIGAVHVGEKDYYDQLNKLFESYDVVLYELVAPEGTRVPRGGRKGGGSAISYLQKMMKDVLKLEFQLDQIDYSVANLVHADMSPDEFSKSMKDRGESFLKMFLKAMGQAMAQQSKGKNVPSDMELLVALIAKDRAYRLKRLMATQFEDMEGQLAAINGPEGSTLITERNKKALQVLRTQIGQGKKHLAVFYGAGHLPDMAMRLERDFSLRRQNQRWLVAWTIAPLPQEKKPQSMELKEMPAKELQVDSQPVVDK